MFKEATEGQKKLVLFNFIARVGELFSAGIMNQTIGGTNEKLSLAILIILMLGYSLCSIYVVVKIAGEKGYNKILFGALGAMCGWLVGLILLTLPNLNADDIPESLHEEEHYEYGSNGLTDRERQATPKECSENTNNSSIMSSMGVRERESSVESIIEANRRLEIGGVIDNFYEEESYEIICECLSPYRENFKEGKYGRRIDIKELPSWQVQEDYVWEENSGGGKLYLRFIDKKLVGINNKLE